MLVYENVECVERNNNKLIIESDNRYKQMFRNFAISNKEYFNFLF